MDDIQKAIECNELNKQDRFDMIEKGKALPIGTIKKRPNGNFIKTANGWKYHSKAGSGVSGSGDSVDQEMKMRQMATKDDDHRTETNVHVSDMSTRQMIAQAKKLGINVANKSASQLRKELVSKNIDREFSKFKEQKGKKKTPNYIDDDEGENTVSNDNITEEQAKEYVESRVKNPRETVTSLKEQLRHVKKKGENKLAALLEEAIERKRAIKKNTAGWGKYKKKGSSLVDKDKTYQISPQGKGEMKVFRIEAVDGSHMVDMTFSSKEEAQKFIDKHDVPTEKKSHSKKVSEGIANKKSAELTRLFSTYSNMSDSGLKNHISAMKRRTAKMEKEDQGKPSAERRSISINERKKKAKLLEQVLKMR